ncbi:MAG: peptidoglycan-binding protein LysM [Bacteroidota bacterium]
MIKRWLFYIGIALIVGFVSMAFKPLSSKDQQWFYVDKDEVILYEFPSKKTTDYISLGIPFTGKFFIGFKEAIGFKESQGKYNTINSLGYLGKYQFGKETLATIGIKDSSRFINSPKLQEKAFVALLSKNKWELRNEIEKYEGKIVDGVTITESGILAAAHLGGVGSVKKFLRTEGRKKCKDAYGTSVKSYMRQFAGYETDIVADKNPTL